MLIYIPYRFPSQSPLRSPIFSCVGIELRNTNVIYHMKYTNRYIFKGLSYIDCADLKHDTHNVLKWGTPEGKKELKESARLSQRGGMESGATKAQRSLLPRRGNVPARQHGTLNGDDGGWNGRLNI